MRQLADWDRVGEKKLSQKKEGWGKKQAKSAGSLVGLRQFGLAFISWHTLRIRNLQCFIL